MNVDRSSHQYFVREAKRAGVRGDPDPSRSTAAPSCFDALRHQTEELIHEQIGAFLDEIEPNRATLATHAHLDHVLASRQELTEREERVLVAMQQARGAIQHAVDRVQPRLGSILSAYSRTRSDMQQAYRLRWAYRAHFDELVFPKLEIDGIAYSAGVAGLDLAGLLAKPFTPWKGLPH